MTCGIDILKNIKITEGKNYVFLKKSLHHLLMIKY